MVQNYFVVKGHSPRRCQRHKVDADSKILMLASNLTRGPMENVKKPNSVHSCRQPSRRQNFDAAPPVAKSLHCVFFFVGIACYVWNEAH